MNIYLIILLSYVAFICLFGLILLRKSLGCSIFSKYFGSFILLGLMWTVLIPIFMIIWPYFLWKYLEEDAVEKTFTIHPLTEENKITLRQLGFLEGKLWSKANIEFDGFKLNKITVCNDGRVCVWRGLQEDLKYLIKVIKNLPNKPKEEQTTEQ